MKTAELIPLILMELDECDKYGLELTKDIESISNGKIVIKQPTLYTVLKKLEKSKFITSYWKDSDIGGKRHYYKLTHNGKMQASTLPSINTLINNIISEKNVSNLKEVEKNVSNDIHNTNTNISFQTNNVHNNEYKDEEIQFNLIEKINAEPEKIENTKSNDIIHSNININASNIRESIVPSVDVFSFDNIDNTTESDINMFNTHILKTDKETQEENFANNKDVSKFTQKAPCEVTEEYKMQLKNINSFSNSLHNETIKPTQCKHEEIKYREYIDFKKDANHIYANKMAKNLLIKIICTMSYLALMIVISSIVVYFTGKSPIYFVSLIIGLVAFIFYPALYAFNYWKIRLNLIKQKLKIDIRKRIVIAVIIELIVVIIVTVVNISLGINSISRILALKNFSNFYVPILVSMSVFIDTIFSYIFLQKIKN